MHCPECHAFNNNGSRECIECKYKFPNPIALFIQSLTIGSKSALLGGIIIFGIVTGWSIALFFNDAKAHNNLDPASISPTPVRTAEMNNHIQSLMQKALTAYQEDRIVTPVNDNAIYYIRAVLKLDSTNVIMTKLRETIIGFYEEKATEAVETRDHKAAIAFYSKLLNIFPDDPNYQKQILSTIPKVLYEQSNNQLNSAIAQSLQEQQKTNRNPRKKQSLSNSKHIKRQNKSALPAAEDINEALSIRDMPKMISSERLTSLEKPPTPVSEISDDKSGSGPGNIAREEKESFVPVAAAGATTKKNENIPDNSEKDRNTTNTDPAIISAAPPKSISDEISTTVPIIIEGLLDKRRREYIHREPAKYPIVYQKIEREGKVILEVIVGLDGNIEDYKVLKSDGNPFTQSAVKALQKFKLKPGTFKGKPVKFKIIERFDFNLGL